MPDVRMDQSAGPDAQRAGLVAALEARRVDNAFHYISVRGAARWRALASSHSPAHDPGDGLLAYDQATRALIGVLPPGPVHVIGVACGDGSKERRLLGALAGSGLTDLTGTPVDVSVPLVTAAARAMAAVPGVVVTHAVVADITVARDLSPLVAPRRAGARLATLFGVLSSLGPDALGPATSVLDPGDLLMVSANLLPPGASARADVMAGYDNPATRHWLSALLEDIGIHEAGGITFRWDDSPGGRAIVGEITLRSAVTARLGGVAVTLPPGEPIRLLQSYRHTPADLGSMVVGAGLRLVTVCTSPGGEEGVAVAVRPG